MNSDYLTLDEASALIGMNRRALAERARRGVLPRYRDPRDQRRILVARKDLDQFFEPVEITTTEQMTNGNRDTSARCAA